MKHNGKTVHQSARDLLNRMKLRKAANMAEHYAAQADPDSNGAQHWRLVADLLHQTSALNTNPVYDQAEQDDKMANKPKQEPKQTDEELALERVTDLCKAIDRKLTLAHNTVAQFIDDMKRNPHHAMECSHGVFKATAIVQVFTLAMQSLTDDDGKPIAVKSNAKPGMDPSKVEIWGTVKYLLEYAQKEVNRRSRDASMSTSPTHNLMEREMLAAWSMVIETALWS